jgi:uncharacterized protein GlcG (DUF336 family)
MSLRTTPWQLAMLGASIAVLASCGGSGSSSSPSTVCTTCTAATLNLTSADVQVIVAQAAGEAAARNAPATIAVTDRVGNVLAVFRMTGAATTFTISGGRGVSGGLENISVLPDYDAAISKAITGAYLSSAGNAFSTRTASQIIQQNFNPGELNQPSGPLFGLQFSQLSCSDLMQRATSGGPGPQRSPLGLAGAPGGLPLYKNGAVVGGIGVISTSAVHGAVYGLDLDIRDVDQDPDELIAVAGATGYAAPTAVRADRITADGRALRYVDSESLVSTPSAHAGFAALPGALVAVPGYAAAVVKDGVVFGTTTSGIRADTGAFADLSGWVLVDSGNTPRYPVVAGSDALLTQTEVQQILRQGLSIANRARAQIRQPLGQAAQVSIAVVDTAGNVLGLVRTPDAPLFGIDVSLQKARTALLFSQTGAAAQLSALPAAHYLNGTDSPIAAYVTTSRAFFGNPNAFADGTAYSARAIGNLSRPFFPDGLNGNGPGPLSKVFANWSPFTDGLQLDLIYNALIASTGGDTSVGCTGLPQVRNGIQIFPGSVPVYRGNQLIGAIGVSGDGVDQDDLVAFLGLAKAGTALGTGVGNAPAGIRADQLVMAGTRLRYVQCPQTPFIDSSDQDVCSGL